MVHLGCLAAIWTGVSPTDLIIAVGLYALRIFGISAGYHRYFAHRSFKTSRIFAFVLAFVAQSSAQRGILWWAGKHRQHHRFSDTDADVHSPVRQGFWHAHLGWIFDAEHKRTDVTAVPDLAKYPELVWLDRHPYLPASLVGFLVWLFAGWSGLVVGFLWSTVAIWHVTFSVNSLAHLVGRRRYETGDQSRNNWWLAVATFGEGWHNNHHHYQGAVRQGFRWYEIDISYYLLRALAAMRVVWDLHSPPTPVVRNEQRLRRVVVEKAAAQLAASFSAAHIATDLHAVMAEKGARLSTSITGLRGHLKGVTDIWRHQLDARVVAVRDELRDALHTPQRCGMPTIGDLRARADAMFVHTPSMNEIVERAGHKLVGNVLEELLRREATRAAATA